jgi:lipoprotein-releasing system permease protein
MRFARKSYILWMAWRYLSAKKGKSLSFLTMMSVLGIAIGVAALVVVLSVMGGFEKDLRTKMFQGLPHLEVTSENAMAGFSLKDLPLTTFKKLFPQAEGVEPYTQSDVILKNGKYLSSGVLFGIDPQLKGSLWGFSQGMKVGNVSDLESPDPKAEPDSKWEHAREGIILGEGLSLQLGVGIGDEVDVISPHLGIGNVLTGGQLSQRFRVVGFFSTDLPSYDTKYAVVNLSSGRKFLPDYDYSLDEDEYVSGVAINFSRPEKIDDYVGVLKPYPQLKVVTWKDVNKSLLFALKLEKFTMGAILLLIVLVAAFSISGTLMMTVFHKRSHIALMQSLGMSRFDVAKLFLTHGLCIGTVGVIIGLALGLSLCSLIYYFQFINLPDGVYYQSKLPVRFLPFEYLIITFCAWGLSLLASLYPALVASRQDPGVGLRYM